jgi:hypothetical protein
METENMGVFPKCRVNGWVSRVQMVVESLLPLSEMPCQPLTLTPWTA